MTKKKDEKKEPVKKNAKKDKPATPTPDEARKAKRYAARKARRQRGAIKLTVQNTVLDASLVKIGIEPNKRTRRGYLQVLEPIMDNGLNAILQDPGKYKAVTKEAILGAAGIEDPKKAGGK